MNSRSGTVTVTGAVDSDMIDPIAFLMAKAEELRDLANLMPEVANELRRMAEDCEDRAEELMQDRRRRA